MTAHTHTQAIMADIRSPNVVFFYGALLRPRVAIVIECV
jgi:hypothetical protein